MHRQAEGPGYRWAPNLLSSQILEVLTSCARLSTKRDQGKHEEIAVLADFEDGNPSDEALIHIPEHACD